MTVRRRSLPVFQEPEEMPEFVGTPSGEGRRFAVVASRFNETITQKLAEGAVVRGDTPHFDYVAGEASRGLSQASADFDRPIGFGLLTCDTMEQAEARAGGAHGNKGWDAALAALEMADLFDRIENDGPGSE